MKECCLYATCQLILLLFEISAPEQASQGQTTARSSVIKVSGLCCRNTCATIMFRPLCVTRALEQTHTYKHTLAVEWETRPLTSPILKPACCFLFLLSVTWCSGIWASEVLVKLFHFFLSVLETRLYNAAL